MRSCQPHSFNETNHNLFDTPTSVMLCSYRVLACIKVFAGLYSFVSLFFFWIITVDHKESGKFLSANTKCSSIIHCGIQYESFSLSCRLVAFSVLVILTLFETSVCPACHCTYNVHPITKWIFNRKGSLPSALIRFAAYLYAL